MSELEALISKHLDGELSPSELVELRRLLASSPDALATFREMTAIRRAARRAPTMRSPSPATEARLFRRLGREGLGPTPVAPAGATRVGASRVGASRSVVSRVGASRAAAPMTRRMAAAASLFLIALIAVGSLLTLFVDAPQPNAPVASVDGAATAPRTGTASPELADARSARTDGGAADERGVLNGRRDSDALASNDALASTDGIASTDGARLPSTSQRARARRDRSDARQTSVTATAIDRSALRFDGAENPTTRPSDGAGIDGSVDPSNEARPTDTAPSETVPSETAPIPYAERVDSIPTLDPRLADAPPLLPVPDSDRGRPGVGAAVRYGTSIIDGTPSERAQDFSVGLELAVADGQRLTLLAGRSAAVTEQRAFNTHSVPARVATSDDKDEGASLQRVDETPVPYDLDVDKEWWLGLGYNVDLLADNGFEISAGARGGVGARSLRVGLEAPVRYNLSDRFAIEAVMSGAYVVPHNSARNEFSVQSTSDGFLYEGETEHTSFSTYGVSIGVRVALD